MTELPKLQTEFIIENTTEALELNINEFLKTTGPDVVRDIKIIPFGARLVAMIIYRTLVDVSKTR